MNGIDLADKFAKIDEYWSPKIVAQMNGQYMKLAKFKGEFIWHSHEHEDEYFQVFDGSITIHLRDRVITLNKGDCYVVSKGVEHKPVAEEEACVIMIEPISTQQTGDEESDRTVKVEDQAWI